MSVPSRQISPLSLLKCGLTAPKSPKLVIFWYKFAQSEFYKIWLGRGSPRFALSCQISSLWVRKCGSTAPKSPKLAFLV